MKKLMKLWKDIKRTLKLMSLLRNRSIYVNVTGYHETFSDEVPFYTIYFAVQSDDLNIIQEFRRCQTY